MTITIRKSSSGRVVVESDGCSDYYGGALVQGAIICRVSMPESVATAWTDASGTFDLRAFRRACMSMVERPAGVRFVEWRHVQ